MREDVASEISNGTGSRGLPPPDRPAGRPLGEPWPFLRCRRPSHAPHPRRIRPVAATAEAGGRRVRVELLDVADSLAEDLDLLLSLDELLRRLAQEDDAAARLAHLHLFGGLSVKEAGEVLGLSRPVAYRNWK